MNLFSKLFGNSTKRISGHNISSKGLAFLRMFEEMEGMKGGTKAHEYIELSNKVKIDPFRSYESFLDTSCRNVWATFVALSKIADVLVATTFNVMQDGKPEPLDKNKNDLAKLIARPNMWDSWEDLIYQWTFHMKTTGNAYWLKDESNGHGQPVYLYPLLPQFVSIIPDREKRIKEYQYQVNGNIIIFQPEDIIHFRRPHPKSLVLGMGDVEPSVKTFQNFIAEKDMKQKFYENGASPSGILSRKDEMQDEDEWEALVAKWRSKYEGKKNVGKTAFLNGDWTFTKMGFTMEEMQALEHDKWEVSQIFMIHGVPLSVAGLENSANYNTAKQDDIRFRRTTCQPLADILIGTLNSPRGLAPAYGDDLQVNYNMSGLVDIEQIVKDYGPLVGKAALSPNELREMCGLSVIDNVYLDQYFIETGLTPVEMAGTTIDSGLEGEIKGAVFQEPRLTK